MSACRNTAHPHAFGYGFGGVAWADVTSRVEFLGQGAIESEDSHVGWTAGLGIEHALSNNFSVRVEYSHVDLGEGDGILAGLDRDISHETEVKFDAIKVGASYKFGGRDDLEPMK